jgi:hypothetical protein
MSNLEIISFNKQQVISNKQILYFFYNYFIKHIDVVLAKFKDYNNRVQILSYACNIIFNVFWIIFDSSNNIFMSLFLSEKSILLYIEFIILSHNSELIENIYYKPTIIDAVNFSYKKTIYNINIDSLFRSKNKYEIFSVCFFFKELMKLIYIRYDNFNTIKKKNIIETINNKNYTFDNKSGLLFYNKFLEDL